MTTVRLLKNGTEAFPAMFAAMDRAATSLALEMYIIADDGTGQEFRRHLIEAAKRGVSVHVLIDSWGCWNLPDSFWDELRIVGGFVRWFHPLLKGFFPFRNHRKLLLVDGRIAYIGGFNISDAYYQGTAGSLPWRDNALEIEGPEVLRLRYSFARMWSIADSPLRRLMRRLHRTQRRAEAMQGTVRFLESRPENVMRPIRSAYRQMIQGAAKNVDLATGYFYPHGLILRSLKRAVKRGVQVRLLLPMHTDVPIARWAAWGLYGRLLRAGIEVWEYTPSMLHSKIAISEDTVIAGSANLDIRSGKFNYEIVAVVTDPKLSERARNDFEEDLRQAVPIHFGAWNNRSLVQKLKEALSYCLLARFDVLITRGLLVRRPGPRFRPGKTGK